MYIHISLFHVVKVEPDPVRYGRSGSKNQHTSHRHSEPDPHFQQQ